MTLKLLPRLVAFVATTMALAGSALAYSGAIFTTWPDGLTVNGNIYDSKDHVYLNGGPQNQNSAGLPVGKYYFQVTDPSGKVLLSSDFAVNRVLVVAANGNGNGVVSGADPTVPAPHANGSFNAANGSTPVQLMPYNDTPNNGGEYKAWLIPVEKATIDIDGTHLHFLNRDAKTDNFKVRTDGPPPEGMIFVTKFYDSNGDGAWAADFSEPPIPGFKFRVQYTAPNGTPHDDVAFTDINGNILIEALPGSHYTVTEFLPTSPGATWHESLPNGTTGGDAFLNGTLYGYSGTVPQGARETLFGNYATTDPKGGLTLGFWSNKNGRTILTGSPAGNVFNGTALAAMTGKNLVDGAGNPAVPFNNYTSFRSWILGANATNMANMLSAQLAAMEFNSDFGFENHNTTVFVPDTNVTDGGAPIGFTLLTGDGAGHNANVNEAVGGWTITIGDLLDAGVETLGANSLTIGSGQVRTYQDAAKTLIDQLNNNKAILGFILAPIPAFTYPPSPTKAPVLGTVDSPPPL